MQCLYLFNIFWDLPPRCEVWYVPISMSTTVLFADANLCNDTNIEPFYNTNIVLYSFRQVSSSERTKYTRWKIWWRHTHIVRIVVWTEGKEYRWRPKETKANSSARQAWVQNKNSNNFYETIDYELDQPNNAKTHTSILLDFFFRHIFALFFRCFFLWMLCVFRICTNNVCQNNS